MEFLVDEVLENKLSREYIKARFEQRRRLKYLEEVEARRPYFLKEEVEAERRRQSPGIFSVRWIKNKFQRDVKKIPSVEEKLEKIPAVEEKLELSASSNLAHLFSYEELNLATNCFVEKIGHDGLSSVYRGKLPDNRMVAVKILHSEVKWAKEIINDVRVLSDISHPNLVSLYGCTAPGREKLLLVYEFVPNGTIYDHLHGELSPLSWSVRLRVAVETAKALTHLHSLEPPIIHGDVKTSNILLDSNFHVKVTMPQGTSGFQEPDYEESSKITVKSDVYCFGMVLLELLQVASGEQAESDIRMIDLVAELARVCLQREANVRPSMMEVHSKLMAIRDGTEPFTARVFSYEELNEATNGFTERIGRGGYGSVYSGKLRGDRMVAVKVLFEGRDYVKEFVNEAGILSSVHHPNLVSLYGSTDRESQKLMLVYEFVHNGTIFDHLHGELSPLSWAMRMGIAIETAKGLTYLHSLKPPIVHRDVKTENILLDEDFHVKVADFGLCRLLPLDKKSVATRLLGTQGYLDPDYESNFQAHRKK